MVFFGHFFTLYADNNLIKKHKRFEIVVNIGSSCVIAFLKTCMSMLDRCILLGIEEL